MQIDPHHHYDSCGGPRCCRYCSHILNESPEEGAARIEAENHARGLRSASQSEFRTSTKRECAARCPRSRTPKATAACNSTRPRTPTRPDSRSCVRRKVSPTRPTSPTRCGPWRRSVTASASTR